MAPSLTWDQVGTIAYVGTGFLFTLLPVFVQGNAPGMVRLYAGVQHFMMWALGVGMVALAGGVFIVASQKLPIRWVEIGILVFYALLYPAQVFGALSYSFCPLALLSNQMRASREGAAKPHAQSILFYRVIGVVGLLSNVAFVFGAAKQVLTLFK